MITNPLHLLALIAGLVALAFWLEHRFDALKKFSATLMVIIFGAIVSNTGLVAQSSPVYDALDGPVTLLAIVWLLFSVNLRDLLAAGPSMLIGFLIAALATTIAAFAATFIFAKSIGPEAWKLGGVLTGTYTGGSHNFVSVKTALGLDESLAVAATAADNFVTALWIAATLSLATILKRFSKPSLKNYKSKDESPFEITADPQLRIVDIAILLAIGFAVMLGADTLQQLLARSGVHWLAGIPSILWLTTLALALAQLPFIRRLQAAMPMGLIALHFFFVVMGIRSRFDVILEHGLAILWITLTVVLIHGILIYGIALLRRSDLEETSVASQAAIGGPSTALALAIARKQPHLALPGLSVGLLGYAVGTYAGVLVGHALRAML
ncbi:MAG: DUF819 family protein [Verrucomicrobiota bacterium]